MNTHVPVVSSDQMSTDAHSGRHSLIAVAEDRAVGVDIEMHRAMSDLLGVAMSVATAREIEGEFTTAPVVRPFQ